jgi:molybdate/tungstate transport system ATP-binding protein
MGLRLENISKTWRGFQLQNINLTIEKGEYFILLGPTGAGKTLLLETIMGFQKPDHGRIILNGEDITEFAPEKRGVGYVSQNCLLFPHLNVRQNVEFGLKMRGIPQPKEQSH